MKEALPQYAIIVAGGIGRRMNKDIPKQFLTLGNKPIIIHTIHRFLEAIPDIDIIIVVHSKWRADLENLLEKYFFERELAIVTGGESRFHSVKNGLELIKDLNGKVAIHDAVRPFVSIEVIREAMTKTMDGTGIIPAIKSRDSVRVLTEDGSKAMERESIRLVQTPQCFMTGDIKKAFETPYNEVFTDDAGVFEKAGGKIELVEGNVENIKITSPMDMRLAGLLLND